jgi:hypothetical protein
LIPESKGINTLYTIDKTVCLFHYFKKDKINGVSWMVVSANDKDFVLVSEK